tara:strand:+ start:3984 stop:4838 length:855 start_codon:yes stop_codon:yes gene_type:complete
LNEWLKLSSEEKELYLNPKKSVPDHQVYQKFATKSADKFREVCKKKYLNLSYGHRPNQKLDIFLPDNNINNYAVQIYYHGGYWIGRDKYDHSHLALPAIKNNIIHVSVNYDLSPNVNIDVIVQEAYESILWVIKNIGNFGGNVNNINLIGHSAGAHLVAMALTKNYKKKDFLNSATLISGIYQPQITKYISINNIINISDETINLTDVYKHPLVNKTNFLLVVGDEEPNSWKMLTADYGDSLKNKNIPFIFYSAIKLNHFTIVRDLANPNSQLAKKVLKMCQKE